MKEGYETKHKSGKRSPREGSQDLEGNRDQKGEQNQGRIRLRGDEI